LLHLCMRFYMPILVTQIHPLIFRWHNETQNLEMYWRLKIAMDNMKKLWLSAEKNIKKDKTKIFRLNVNSFTMKTPTTDISSSLQCEFRDIRNLRSKFMKWHGFHYFIFKTWVFSGTGGKIGERSKGSFWIWSWIGEWSWICLCYFLEILLNESHMYVFLYTHSFRI